MAVRRVEREPKPEHVRELRAYGIGEDGRLGPPRVLLTFGSDQRGPQRGVEGLCRAGDGNIIACGGWRKSGAGPAVYVFSPQGELLDRAADLGHAPIVPPTGTARTEHSL